MTKVDVSVPSGMRDILPQVATRREWMFDTVRSIFRRHGYQPIETPAIERAETLLGKYGSEADKLLYFVQSSGNLHEATWDKALRYDLTVPLARYVVRNRNNLVFPFKRYQIQNVWRGDRPQKGRYREFFQCDVDVVGSESIAHEADLTEILYECLTELGVKGFKIRINHRALLFGMIEHHGLKDQFGSVCLAIDKLDKVGTEGVLAELEQRGIDLEKGEALLSFLASHSDLPLSMTIHLKQAIALSESGKRGLNELEQLSSFLKGRPEVLSEVTLDLTLARGLDYYTGVIWEVVVPGSGFGSLCGGGRYANLTELFGWSGGSGVGVSLGIDRIYDVLDAAAVFESHVGVHQPSLLAALFDDSDRDYLMPVVMSLRKAGWACEWYEDSSDKLKKQFAYADRKQIDWVMLAGQDEKLASQCKFKFMKTGEEFMVPIGQANYWLVEKTKS
jgi:histidyl-tRNA synthetase